MQSGSTKVQAGLEVACILGRSMWCQRFDYTLYVQENFISLAMYNVQGQFLALCGFGNLPGDITFLDKKADGKCKVISQVR